MNKPLQVILIDDEPKALKNLEIILTEFVGDIEILGKANSALEGIKLVNKKMPDLVFLDVDMPGGSGFDFLEAFPEKKFEVIFTTASSDHAIKALKSRAADYMLKPIDTDELKESVSKVRALLEAEHKTDIQKLALPIQGGYQYVDFCDIVNIENDGNYTTFYLKDNSKVLISKNIGYFIELLNPAIFFRCHQSHIINLKEIKQLNRNDGTYLIMSNGNRVEVSRSKKDELYEVMG